MAYPFGNAASKYFQKNFQCAASLKDEETCNSDVE